MATKIFVNIPVKDLKKSIEFFTKLDFTFNLTILHSLLWGYRLKGRV
jgi:predicted lactoylglutathione lyase